MIQAQLYIPISGQHLLLVFTNEFASSRIRDWKILAQRELSLLAPLTERRNKFHIHEYHIKIKK
jgi:hypothetical protein